MVRVNIARLDAASDRYRAPRPFVVYCNKFVCCCLSAPSLVCAAMTRAPASRRRTLVAAATNARRAVVPCLRFVLPLYALAGCSSGDTVLALNVTSSDTVGFIEKLEITVRQGERAAVMRSITPPTKELEKDAGTVIAPRFFERIALPSSWDEGPAEVRVRAFAPDAPALMASTTAEIEPGEAVAAYVEFDREEPDSEEDEPADGGSDGGATDAATRADGASDAGTDGGASDGGADADKAGRT